MNEFERLVEKQVKTQEVFAGKIMCVHVDDIELPNGEPATREYITHTGAVCVVALTDDGNVIMERQYRYPMGRVLSEIPAGKLDSFDEDPLEAAKRELREETGITADNWTSLGRFAAAPAYSEEELYVFLARGLHYGERNLDEGEFLDVYEKPLELLVEEILQGEIADGKTQAAIMKTYIMLKSK